MLLLSSFREKVTHGYREQILLRIVIGIAVMFAASKLYIPSRPVPISFQSTAVILLGLTYTPLQAFSSIAGWLTLGMIGVPVFAGHSAGLSVLLGHTGGYIMGFLITAPLMAAIQSRFQPWLGRWMTPLSSLFGTCLIMLCGVVWLARFYPLAQAIQSGFIPFIIPGLFKTALLVAILRMVKPELFRPRDRGI